MVFVIRIVAFDLDQTLIDSFKAHNMAVKQAVLRTFNIHCSLAEIDFAGKPAGENIKQIVLKHGIKNNEWLLKKDKVLKAYNDFVIAICNEKPWLIKKLACSYSLLKDLSKHKILVLVTGTPIKPAKELLRSVKLDTFFNHYLTGDDAKTKKPLMKKLSMLASSYGLKPSNVCFIGDSVLEMELAKGFGFKSIGVATGLHSVEELNQAADLAVKTLCDYRVKEFLSK